MQSKGYRLSYETNLKIALEGRARLNVGYDVYLSSGVALRAENDAVISIGDRFFVNKNSSILARYGITIGDDCMIGEQVTIIDHNHVFENTSIPFNQQGYTGKTIVIGNNVWIGSGVFIGPGVHIGSNVVIGAGTVVTKSIPSGVKVYNRRELVMIPLFGDER